MAKTVTIPNKMQLPDSIGRMNARPIDGDSFFTSTAAARAYAASGATAYVGQLLTVVENNVVTMYTIADTSGTLRCLLDESKMPAGGGGGVGSRVTLTPAQVTALIAANGSYTFSNVESGKTVTVLAVYVNGLMQDAGILVRDSVNTNQFNSNLTTGDPEIVTGDTVDILYSVSED